MGEKNKKIVLIDENNANILKQLMNDDVLEIIVDNKEKGIINIWINHYEYLVNYIVM